MGYETYAPWAENRNEPGGIPAPKYSVETDYGEYTSLANTEVAASVTIRNTGSADILNGQIWMFWPRFHWREGF